VQPYARHVTESSGALPKNAFMISVLPAIFLLGIVAGLRAFTAPAALWLMRYGGLWAFVLAALALLEYVGDLYPRAPARTGAPGLIARVASGAFVGWSLATSTGTPVVAGVVVALAGVAVGAYGGLALRLKAIAAVGAFPSAILEDVVAIVLAVLTLSLVAKP
jgi:uncharacterized membrane protein